MALSICEITQSDVLERFFYPPVGLTERQWDLFVEGTGQGTWPSEVDPVWHPLSGGTEVRFAKFDWQDGYTVAIAARSVSERRPNQSVRGADQGKLSV